MCQISIVPHYVWQEAERVAAKADTCTYLVTYCGVWCEIITVQYVSTFCSGNFEWSSTHFWATSLNENTIGRLYFACMWQEIRNKSLLSRALSVHRRKTNITCTPCREDSFIYKNPENLYKRSVHFRKSRRRERDFWSSLSSENYILEPKHKTGNVGEVVKQSIWQTHL